MSRNKLDKDFSLGLNSTFRNVVDYLIISRNLDEGHWDENPVKTALCYRALKPIGELKNPSITEEWMIDWFNNLDKFEKSKTQFRRNLRKYIEGAAEIIESLPANMIDRDIAKNFFYDTRLGKSGGAGSWQNEISLTAKIVSALEKLQIEIPDSTYTWIKSKSIENLSERELANLVYYTDLNNLSEYISELEHRLSREPELTLSEISALLKVDEITVPGKYLSHLQNKIQNSSSFQINAGLTKALWQCVVMRSASYSSEDIKKNLTELDDRYWVNYIEEITDDSKIILDLNRDLSKLTNGNRDIETLAKALIALQQNESLQVVEVPKSDYRNLLQLQKEKDKKNLIGKSLIAEKWTMTTLGLIAGLSLYGLAYNYDLTAWSIWGKNVGHLAMTSVVIILTWIGYKGGLKYGWKKLKEKVKRFF